MRRFSQKILVCQAFKILPSTGIKYFLNVTGFSHMGKWPISSMMMHSEFLTRAAVLRVFSGVQAQSTRRS